MRAWPSAFAALLVGSLLFVRAGDSSFAWLWIYRWVLLEGLFFLFLAIRVGEEVGALPGLTLGYFSLVALLYSATPVWEGVDPRIQGALHLAAAHELVALSAIAAILFSRSEKWVQSFFQTTLMVPLCLAAVAVAGGVLLTKDVNAGVPLLHNPSIAGSFLAIIAVGSNFLPIWLLCGAAIVHTGASTPLLALLAGVLSRGLCRQRRLGEPRGLLTLGVCGLLALCVGFVGAADAHDGNGRFPVWALVWRDFWHGPLWAKLFGNGLGSTPLLVPLLQLDARYDPQSSRFFMYLHNDWLQLLYEAGLIGFGLSVALYLGAVYHSRYNPRWAAMLAAYGVAMLTNFPLHQPLLALLGIVLLGGAYLEEKRCK